MKSLSVQSFASIIGVSTATIRNWARAGYLTPVNARPLGFLEQDAIKLKRDIGSGSVARLRTRANKSSSDASIIPKEYAANSHLTGLIRQVVETFKRERLDLGSTMYFASLRRLELSGELARIPDSTIHDLNSFHSWKRAATRNEMVCWFAELGTTEPHGAYSEIYFSLSDIEKGDFLGLLYQSLNNEGDKSNKGSYYTPSNIVNASLNQGGLSAGTFLDPCCGTGNYLRCAAKLLKLSPEQIYGFDSDGLAVRIARVNLLLAFPGRDFTPNIACLNTLTELATGGSLCATNHLIEGIDFIATNPPWGSCKNSCIPSRYAHGVKSNQAFSLFLAKSLQLLKPGGRLSFILPESILKIRTHRDIREIILNDATIVRISKLGRQFTGVFTAAIRLDLIKGKAARDWLVSIEESGKVFQIAQSRFAENEHYAFDVDIDQDEDLILKKLYSIDHVTLSGNAEWALGIVTGNNKKYVSEFAEEGMESIFKGSDIFKFGLRKPQAYLHFKPDEFQQVAKESFYRAPEKLIYKFISKSLVFAYDDQQRLTLNSANILIPHLPGLSIGVTLAFLNSNVSQYIFSKKYSTHKVLRGDLENLPFPIMAQDLSDEIESLVDAIHAGEDEFDKLQDLIYSAFHLSNEEIHLIRVHCTAKIR